MTELKRLFVYALFSLFYSVLSGKSAHAQVSVDPEDSEEQNIFERWTSPSGHCGRCSPDTGY